MIRRRPVASHFLKAASTSTTSHGPGDGCNANVGTQCQSSHWAGNISVSSDGHGDRGIYRATDMVFNVPTVSLNDPGADASTWVGVGGANWVTGGVGLVQAGVDAIAQQGGQFDLSWIEALNSDGSDTGTIGLPLCRLAKGDTIGVYVASNDNNSGYDYFSMMNYSDNDCFASCMLHTSNKSIKDTCGQATGGSQYNSDSATGECIVEKLGGIDLAQFNPPGNHLPLSQCKVNGIGIGDQSHQYAIIVSSGLFSHLIAGVGPITGGQDYSVNWVANN